MHRDNFARGPAAMLVLVAAMLIGSASDCPGQSRFARRALSTASSNVGYIDTSYVGDMFRLRFDSATGNNLPDRAEFFYAKCGCFRVAGLDPNAPGPALSETNVDFQTLEADVQLALTESLAVFGELPVRLLNPEQNDNTGGLGDVQGGFKYALQNTPEQTLTFQLRGYVPSGDADRGLGTHHFSIEPALLLRRWLSERATFEGEVRDWIPIGGSSAEGTGVTSTSSFAGNILRYGAGVGYNFIDRESWRLTPVAEFVGWTIFDGIASPAVGPPKAINETIWNAKFGVRLSLDSRGSFYAGYGRALSNEVWYEEIVRVEYRLMF